MKKVNKLKIINDPIYGFVKIPNELIYDLIQHPYFQRLRRISQMGLSNLVYPGANHTRFHHALGAMHLMQKAIAVLRFKSVVISNDEENALLIAILLHDIGHGPFSHALEQVIIEKVNHETISLLFMNQLNTEFNNQLALAIKIFEGNYHRKFMLQLISSQMDMDRMDYLKRDSFYSGVAEGNINSDRLIQMMTVVDDVLVIEEKAIYSVEKFLMARRLMYWQVYLHKTSLVAELILSKIFKRAKELTHKKINITGNENLLFFLQKDTPSTTFDTIKLNYFAQLDDTDIYVTLKSWQNNPDFILSTLSKMIVNRDLLKIKISDKKISKPEEKMLLYTFSKKNKLSIKEAKYFIFNVKVTNQSYNKEAEQISVLMKNKTIKNIIDVSDQMLIKKLSKVVIKHYTCFPNELNL